MGLEELLNDPSDVDWIGSEKGSKPINGIALFKNAFGSYRYVYYINQKAVSGLQLVSRDGVNAVIATVYTRPHYRRRGFAEALLKAGRQDFAVVEHAPEKDLSDEGRVWRDKVHENPVKHSWWWIGGAVVTFFGLFALNRYMNAQVQAKIQSNLPPGVTIQPNNLTDVYIVPKSRESVNLSLSASDGMLKSFNLHFVSNGSLTFTPATGVVDVEPTSSGATITAVGEGSATLTVVYAPDTTGLQDAIVGVGVFA
jgi:GNAT superfamily N-acetyltransferase